MSGKVCGQRCQQGEPTRAQEERIDASEDGAKERVVPLRISELRRGVESSLAVRNHVSHAIAGVDERRFITARLPVKH